VDALKRGLPQWFKKGSAPLSTSDILSCIATVKKRKIDFTRHITYIVLFRGWTIVETITG